MAARLVDVRDINELSNALRLVLFFTEYVNGTTRFWVRKYGLGRAPQTLQLKQLLERSEQTFEQAVSKQLDWRSQFVDLARGTGIQPTYQKAVIRALVDILTKRAAAPSLEAPQKLDENFYLYRLAGGHGFASQSVLSRELLNIRVPLIYWDEALHPISTLQAFLMDVLGESLYSADHYIQSWLRHDFDLHYEQTLKYRLIDVCERFNSLFYGSPSPSHQEFHTRKAATVDLFLVFQEVARILSENSEHPKSGPGNTSLRRAMGIYLFFRFCRQLRCRYQWLDVDSVQESSSLQGERLLLVRDTIGQGPCVSALRPLEPTYFQTRMFGALSTIPGLNDVLRGGVLPRAASGRTFTVIGSPGAGKTVLALQVMADIARQGRLAVYFSMEESYDSIIDRLATFKLYDPEKFEVVVAGQDLAETLRKFHEAQPRRGLLVLYNEESTDGTYDLSTAIQGIAQAAGALWKWRALTIDSLNALEFNAGTPYIGRRLDLQALIRAIEDSRFLGIVLSERGSSEFDVFNYLSDTVVELSVDDETRARWFEIKKCRTQDYHAGKHQFRIVDGGGVRIYPSLSARMSSLRRRQRTTLSEKKLIPFPDRWESRLGLKGLQEKSSTLIWGPSGSGKTVLMLQLATAPAQVLHEERSKRRLRPQPPTNVLLLTFRTSELNVLQALRHHEDLYSRWKEIRKTRIRWFSPGSNLSGDQIISELWGYIHESRREGTPLDRILFDEAEMAEDVLPRLKSDHLFWPTLFELVATEAITSFFVAGDDPRGSTVVDRLGSSMDYILHLEQSSAGWHQASLQKSPALWMAGPSLKVDFQINPKTGIIEDVRATE